MAGYVAWGWGLMSWQREDADRRAYQRASYAEENIESACVGMERAALVECVKEAIETSREDQRSEYDLAAQESMSRWAWWMLLSSVATVVTAGVGIYYVRETLTATHTDSAISREMGQRQIRAYVQFSHFVFIPIGSPEDINVRIGFDIQLGFINKGTTPGRNCWCMQNGGVLPPESWPLRLPQRAGQDTQIGPTIAAGDLQYPSATFVSMQKMERIILGEDWLAVSGRCDYFDVFGEPHFTEICIHLRPICNIAYLTKETINAAQMFGIVYLGPNNQGD